MLPPAPEEVEEWKVLCGQFLAINATNMSCACPRSPQGLSPAAHLGDGSSDLILIRKCSRFNFLRFLVRHTNQGDQVRAPQVSAASSAWAAQGGGSRRDASACLSPTVSSWSYFLLIKSIYKVFDYGP